jgi:hypothetical protein
MTHKPLHKYHEIKRFEITLHVESGNLIHRTFNNLEELLEFINNDAQDSSKIREIISPKKRKKQIGEQLGFYSTDESADNEDW